jgi:hypothetical protein
MMVTTEVLMYIQSVRNYFEQNPEVRQYFIGNTDEEYFFNKLGEISQKNVDEERDAMLTQEQFEELRMVKKEMSFIYDKRIFMDLGEYGQICLN